MVRRHCTGRGHEPPIATGSASTSAQPTRCSASSGSGRLGQCVGGGATNYTNWWVDAADVQRATCLATRSARPGRFPSCDGASIDSTCALAILTVRTRLQPLRHRRGADARTDPRVCDRGLLHASIAASKTLQRLRDRRRRLGRGRLAAPCPTRACAGSARARRAQQQASSATEKRLNARSRRGARAREGELRERVVGLLMPPRPRRGGTGSSAPTGDGPCDRACARYTFIASPPDGAPAALVDAQRHRADPCGVRAMFAFCLLPARCCCCSDSRFTGRFPPALPRSCAAQSRLGAVLVRASGFSPRSDAHDLQLPLVSAAPDALRCGGPARHVLAGRAA